jgi:hypothetical protein
LSCDNATHVNEEFRVTFVGAHIVRCIQHEHMSTRRPRLSKIESYKAANISFASSFVSSTCRCSLRSRSGFQLWGIEGAPRRQGGGIERGSESAQNPPTTELRTPTPWILEFREGIRREGHGARVFTWGLSHVGLKIQFELLY